MWACNAIFGNSSHVFPSLSRYFHLPWLLALVCFCLFQKSAVVVESVKQMLEGFLRLCNYTSTFMNKMMKSLCCYNYTSTISSVENSSSVHNKQYECNITWFASINKLTPVIYLWWHKLACRSKMAAGECKEETSDGKSSTNLIHFITLFVRDHTTSMLRCFPHGNKEHISMSHKLFSGKENSISRYCSSFVFNNILF